jgi:rhamnogalacturonan endolyase
MYNIFVLIAQGAARQMENLDRGVVVIRQTDDTVFVGWRLLGTDPEGLAFNVYRSTDSGAPTKLNLEPLAGPTHYLDAEADLTKANAWSVRAVRNGREDPPTIATDSSGSAAKLAPGMPARKFLSRTNRNSSYLIESRPFLSIPLQPPANGVTHDGKGYSYTANDAAPADLDGDGEYELILKWDPTNSQDNAFAFFTGNVFLDAYKLDGTRLWRIDLGPNIRAGAHYTQFLVYDLDGDGRAELVCKTADGTTDAAGNVIGDADAFWPDTVGVEFPVRGGTGSILNAKGDPVQTTLGRILSGPEYLTVFEGATGRELATADYVPARGKSEDWGDPYVNRVDRFNACIAYLDGARPSIVMCRGYYSRSTLAAWDWRDGKLTQRWLFDSDDGTPGNDQYRGQGNHGLSVADVDDDGKDDIIYGACVIGSNGKGLYSMGLGHGDAMHVSDLDPTRPGLEIFDIHENARHDHGVEMHDARTGELLWSLKAADPGRGISADIDPRHLGYESWGRWGRGEELNGIRNVKGKQISNKVPSSANFRIWWDGDVLHELLTRNFITKWDWESETEVMLLNVPECAWNNTTKANPCLTADLLGDWREEVVWRTPDNRELRIYTTTIPTERRFYTFMHDPVYRLAVAWQNSSYNQPPHVSFYMGEGMQGQPRANIETTAANR